MRIEVPQRIKNKVLKRNRGYCEVCGFLPSSEVHHIIPLCDGGDGKEEDLAALCHFCHRCVPGKYPDGYKDEFSIYKSAGGILWHFFRMGYFIASKKIDYSHFALFYKQYLLDKKTVQKTMKGKLHDLSGIHIMVS